MLLAGHVVVLVDPWTEPRNLRKLHLCVLPRRRLFLRINTDRYWPTCHPLAAADNPGILKWDSFVELRQLLSFPPGDVARALARPDALLGRMSATEANAVAWAARQAPTLSEELQVTIWDNLHDLR